MAREDAGELILTRVAPKPMSPVVNKKKKPSPKPKTGSVPAARSSDVRGGVSIEESESDAQHNEPIKCKMDVSKDATEAYVLEGELRAGTIVAHAGERLRIDAKGATVSPQGVWEDWTGGLATSSRDSEPAPYGVGTIGARRPGVLGEPFAPMTIQRLDVRVEIRGDLAVTEVD